jgi:ketol-acid reductoisomerase
VTAEERLAEAEERLEDLEGERDRLLGVVEHLVAAVERLAIMAGASPAAAKAPGRAALHVIKGGAS